MKQSISQRLNGVVFSTIKQAAINQPFECDVTATFAPVLNEQGGMKGFGHHWLVTVSIPNPLQGNVDIAVSLPIGGVVPPDEIFERVATQLFDTCMESKRKILSPPEPEPVPNFVPGKPTGGTAPPVLDKPVAPAAPRKKRQRETSFFPSKPGSGEFSADN